MRTLLNTLQPLALPRCVVGPGAVDGRSGTVLVQREEFLADVDPRPAGAPASLKRASGESLTIARG